MATVEGHDRLDIFKGNLIAFREWMAARGYRDKPLIVTEYGILISVRYDFTHPRMSRFLLGTFDFFLSATDEATG